MTAFPRPVRAAIVTAVTAVLCLAVGPGAARADSHEVNESLGRDEWVGGDPMPRLDELGDPLGPATIDGNLVQRAFEGGEIFLNFTNARAEHVVRPFSGGFVSNPNGPFKYLVLGTDTADTLYVGGGWRD